MEKIGKRESSDPQYDISSGRTVLKQNENIWYEHFVTTDLTEEIPKR